MNFEDKLRRDFQRIDADLSHEGLDWTTTITTARRARRMRIATGAAVAATAVVAVGFFARAAVSTDLPITPATSPSPSESPSESPSPSPSESPDATASPAQSGSIEPPPGVEDGNCSAAQAARSVREDESLPEEVRATRRSIIEAAWNCDYVRLAELTGVAEGRPFTYSFGDDGDPARYWQRLEKGGEPVTASLVTLLTMHHRVEEFQIDKDDELEQVYMWPRANTVHPTEEEWQELVEAGLYDQKQVDQMKELEQYFGYRTAIVSNGNWLHFVAGD